MIFSFSDIPEYITNQEAIDTRKRTDQRSILVQGLIPDTGYRFRIRAINSFGRGKEASRPSGDLLFIVHYIRHRSM